MAYLDNSEITVDAILTRKGRELMANGQGINITKFALGDDEIDYSLTHFKIEYISIFIGYPY